MPTAKMTMIDAINKTLHQEMGRDNNIIVLGEDIGVAGGVFRATQGLYEKFGSLRVIDTPVGEAGIIGTAYGMAAAGLRPVAEIEFAAFSYLAFHHLKSHVAKLREKSRGAFFCPLTLRMPYQGGIKALDDHSESLESYFIHTPGLKVVTPSSPYDAKGLLATSIRDNDPVIFLEPSRLYRAFKEEVPEEEFAIPLGKARVVKEGEDVTVISWGAMVRTTLEGINEIQNVSCELIDLRTLSPCDYDAVINSVKKTGKCVIVQEAPKTLGFASEIIARINEKAFYSLEAPIKRVTGFDVPVPLARLEDYYIPDAFRVKKAIIEVMEG